MSTEITNTTVDLSVGAGRWLHDENVRDRIGSALAGWLAPDEFAAQMVIAFQKQVEVNNSPIGTIAKVCSPKSQFEAAMFCAAVQLVPTLNQVALIPRKVKGVWECHPMVQWQGFQSLMVRHPDVRDVVPRIVLKGDEFEFNGTENVVVRHEYDPFDWGRVLKNDLSNLRGGYAVIMFRDGQKKYHMVAGKHIIKARSCAKTQAIWNSWLEAQTLKTILRNTYSRRAVPIDPLVEKRVASVVAQEDRVLQNDPKLVSHPPIQSKPKTELPKLLPDVDPQPSAAEAKDKPEQPEEINIVDAAIIAIGNAEDMEQVSELVGMAEQELSEIVKTKAARKALMDQINKAAKERFEYFETLKDAS